MAISRRDFLRMTGLSLVTLAVPRLTMATAPPGPNLLIIHTDEHNFRTLGCYRRTLPPEQAFMWGKAAVVQTPNIDWIADHGAICTKFYATTPVCAPSRASFVSGKYPQNTPVKKNTIPLNDNIITFADILRQSGYATGYAGKWHLDGEGKPDWAPKRRFGFEDNRYMFNCGHWKKVINTPDGPNFELWLNHVQSVRTATEKNYTTDWLTDRTIEFMDKNRLKPFCYMVGFPDPHDPDLVRRPYNTAFRKMTFRKPRTYDKPVDNLPSWALPQKTDYNQSRYFGMIKCIDDNVGRILEYLRKTKLIDNTIIIFTADHGDMRGEHHLKDKNFPFEASARVPFLIHFPNKIKAGTVVPQALGTVDFLPTILGLMGINTKGTEEGRDASGLLKGDQSAANWKDITFVRGVNGWLAAFTKRYKLIVSTKDDPWLIDMEKDPDELKNFCPDQRYKKVAQALALELLAYGKKFNDEYVADTRIAADLIRLSEGL